MSSKLKCIAIDDEPLALKLLEEYAARTAALEMIRTFDDAISAVEYLKTASVDLLFIDVNMPDITGIDLVRSLETKPMIVFCTAYRKFAFEGFELDAVDYLLKPVEYERFLKAVEKAQAQYHLKNTAANNPEDHIFVRSEYRMVKILLDDIEYIEGLEDYIRIHISNVRPVLTLMTLKSMLEKLPAEKFKRIHRSYIVPLNKIRSIVNKKVTLSSEKELPISDSYIEEINEWMKR